MQSTETKPVPKEQSAKKKALASPPMSQEEVLEQTVEASKGFEPGEGRCASCGVEIDAGITWCDYCDPTPPTEEPESKPIFGTKPLVEYSDTEWEQAYIQVQKDAGQLPTLALKWLNPRLLQEDPENERGPVTREADPTLKDLADSIKERGVLEPLRVYQAGDVFFLQSGHRRRAAAVLAGLALVPCIIVPAPKGPLDQAVDRLTSNLQRKDLSPMEKAKSLKALIDANPITQVNLAQRLGISQGAVGNLLRILELPQPVQDLVAEGKLTAGHAVALLSVKEPYVDWSGKETQTVEEVIIAKAEEAVKYSLSVREVEKRCGEHNRSRAQSRKWAEEEAARKEEMRARQEAQQVRQKQAIEGGTLTPEEAALVNYRNELEAWQKEDAARLEQRRKLWPQVAADIFGFDQSAGPSLDHIRFATRQLANHVFGYYAGDAKPKVFDQIDKALDLNGLLIILAELALRQIRPNYDYMTLPSHSEDGTWLVGRFSVKEKLAAAWEERDLIPLPQPEPPKQEEPVEELPKAS